MRRNVLPLRLYYCYGNKEPSHSPPTRLDDSKFTRIFVIGKEVKKI